ncbi:hypothetical protein DFH27DRAFT_604907, partial [Peziza echinospora]
MERAYEQCVICGVTMARSVEPPQPPDHDPSVLADVEPLPPVSWQHVVRGFYKNPAQSTKTKTNTNTNTNNLADDDDDDDDDVVYTATNGRYYGGWELALKAMYWFPRQHASDTHTHTHTDVMNGPFLLNFKPTPLGAHVLASLTHQPPPHAEGYICHEACFQILEEAFAHDVGSRGGSIGRNPRVLRALFRLMDGAVYHDVLRGPYGSTLQHPLDFCWSETLKLGGMHTAVPVVGRGRFLAQRGGGDPADVFARVPVGVRTRIAGHLDAEGVRRVCAASKYFAMCRGEFLRGGRRRRIAAGGGGDNILARLPTEIVYDVLEMLSFEDVCRAREASRAVAALGLPALLWRVRVRREMGSLFPLAQALVEAERGVDWEQAHALAKWHLTCPEPTALDASLRNRQRIWEVCRSIAAQVAAMADAALAGEARLAVPEGHECRVVTTLGAGEAAGRTVLRPDHLPPTARFLALGAGRTLVGLWASVIDIGGRRFVSGLRVRHRGEDDVVASAGYIHRRHELYLAIDTHPGDGAHHLRLALCDRGIKAIGNCVPGGAGEVVWAGGYSAARPDVAADVGPRGVSYCDVVLKDVAHIGLTIDGLKIVQMSFATPTPRPSAQRIADGPATPVSTATLPPLLAWTPAIPPPGVYDRHASRYYAPRRCHEHYSPLAAVIFDGPSVGGALEAITAFVSKRDGLHAMRFDFDGGAPSRWWGGDGMNGVALTFFLNARDGEKIVRAEVTYTDTQVMQQIAKLKLSTSFARNCYITAAPTLHFQSDHITAVLRAESKPIVGFYGCFYPTRRTQGNRPSLSSFGILTARDVPEPPPPPPLHKLPTLGGKLVTTNIVFPRRPKDNEYAEEPPLSHFAGGSSATPTPPPPATPFSAMTVLHPSGPDPASPVFAELRRNTGPGAHKIHYCDITQLNLAWFSRENGFAAAAATDTSTQSAAAPPAITRIRGWVLSKNTDLRHAGQATGISFYLSSTTPDDDEDPYPIHLGQAYDATPATSRTETLDHAHGERVLTLEMDLVDRTDRGRAFAPYNTQLHRVAVTTSFGRRLSWGRERAGGEKGDFRVFGVE